MPPASGGGPTGRRTGRRSAPGPPRRGRSGSARRTPPGGSRRGHGPAASHSVVPTLAYHCRRSRLLLAARLPARRLLAAQREAWAPQPPLAPAPQGLAGSTPPGWLPAAWTAARPRSAKRPPAGRTRRQPPRPQAWRPLAPGAVLPRSAPALPPQQAQRPPRLRTPAPLTPASRPLGQPRRARCRLPRRLGAQQYCRCLGLPQQQHPRREAPQWSPPGARVWR
mmetsp:Transcript_49245/g.147098  ORF Transcript_49245/g.147098 Transcript_49245/m.147098 type:complete len:223 (-) Transcript_49245:240-908(-)